MIGNGAFCGCSSLRAVELPDGLEEIGLQAFMGSGLKSVATQNSVSVIRQGAFCECKSLREAVLGESLEALGSNEHTESGRCRYGVFQGSALENVRLPFMLRRIERAAFCECGNLKSIALPDWLEQVGDFCFSASGLTQVVFPVSVREVGASAFADCKGLEGVQLNEGL